MTSKNKNKRIRNYYNKHQFNTNELNSIYYGSTDTFNEAISFIKLFDEALCCKVIGENVFLYYEKMFSENYLNGGRLNRNQTNIKGLFQELKSNENYNFSIATNESLVRCCNLKNTNIIGYSNGENLLSAFYEYLERLCGFCVMRNQKFDIEFIEMNEHKFIMPSEVGYSWCKVEQMNLNEYRWVKCFDIFDNKKYYVPLEFSNYGVERGEQGFFGNSNGCAVGNSIKEAVLYGFLEYIERDVFIDFWYFRKNQASRIIFDKNSYLFVLQENFKKRGYLLEFLEMDANVDLMVIWCCIYSIRGEKLFANGLSCSCFGKDDAMVKAFQEANSCLKSMENNLDFWIRVKELNDDDSSIKTLNDINYWFSTEKGYSLMKGIIEEASIKQYENLSFEFERSNNLDILFERIKSFTREKYGNVYYVDQTISLMRKYNKYCVKVFTEKGKNLNYNIDESIIPEQAFNTYMPI